MCSSIRTVIHAKIYDSQSCCSVHLAGTSCDIKKIKELADEYGFSIVEDANHAIGGRFHSHWLVPVDTATFVSSTFQK